MGKKSSEKGEIMFFYSIEYRAQKLGGKKRETNFPEIHEECDQKMLGKKSSEKVQKTFFIFTRI